MKGAVFLWGGIICFLAIAGVQPSFAQDPNSDINIGTLPRRTGPAGFVVSATMARRAANGYQPVYLKVSHPRGIFRRDRNIDVRLSPRAPYRSEMHFDYHVRCEIPENTKSKTFVAMVPYYVPWENIEMEVREDGYPVDTGGGMFGVNALQSRYANQTSTVGIIRPDNDLKLPNGAEPWQPFPDLRSIVTTLGSGPIAEDTGKARLPHNQARNFANRVQGAKVQFRIINAKNLYNRWLGYSQLDVIIVAAPLLASIAEKDPEKIDTIRDWIAAGGNLWVYASELADLPWADVQSRLKPLPQSRVVSQKQFDTRMRLKEDNDTSDLRYEYYRGVYRFSEDYQFQTSGEKFKKRNEVFKELSDASNPMVVWVPPAEISQSIETTRLGTGTITTLKAVNPFPGSFQLWHSVIKAIGMNQLDWTRRQGMSVWHGNDNYWAWLIEAVGQPPVKMFFFLNSMFVLVVGPVSYFFFRKQRRLHLLLFFAPALAFCVTAGLFSFGIVADGLHTRLRARQITWQDSVNEYLVDDARQTYFSVYSDYNGIQLGQDVAIYPVNSTPQEQQRYYYGYRGTTTRQIYSESGVQRIAGRFLPSRTQVQYRMQRPRQSAPLVTFQPGASGVLDVTNHSDKPLMDVIAKDDRGVLYVCQEVAPGATVSIPAATANTQAPKEILGVMELQIPDVVPTLRSARYSRLQAGSSISILEERLNTWLVSMPGGVFMATTDLDETLIGIKDPKTEGSVRVIMGRL